MPKRLLILLLIFIVMIYADTKWQGTYIKQIGTGTESSPPPPPPPVDSIGAEWWIPPQAGYRIGGGPGYPDSFVVTAGNGSDTFYVADSAHFYAVMADSIAEGDLVYIADNAEINIGTTEWLLMDDDLTFCSGRGRTLGDTISWGGLLYTNAYTNDAPLRFYGDNLRFSGLRLRGPDPHYGCHENDATLNTQMLIFFSSPGTIIDNCEIYNAGYGGAAFGDGCIGDTVRYCYFHNEMRRGCGYGVNTANNVEVFVQACLFDFYRHAIAGGTYTDNDYSAEYNICMEHDSEWHSFDKHHGGEGGVFRNNTWQSWQQKGNRVRGFQMQTGTPSESLLIYDTWSYHNDSASTFQLSTNTNVRISDIHYGRIPPDGVAARLPVADGQISTDSGDVPLTVTMKDEASSDPLGTISWYEWDLGMGSADVERVRAESTQYTYTAIGQYHPRFYIYGSTGIPDYDQFTVKAVPAGADQSKFWLSFWYLDSYRENTLSNYLEAQVLVDNDTVWSQNLKGDSVWQHIVLDVTTEVGASDSVTLEMRMVLKSNSGGAYDDIHTFWDDVWGWNLTVRNGDFETDAIANNTAPTYWTAGYSGSGYFGWYQATSEIVSGQMSWLMKTSEKGYGQTNHYVYIRQKIDVVGQ